MPNINKVVFGNQTLIDLSTTTLSAASQLQNGITAYDRAGNVITGTGPSLQEKTVSPTESSIEVLPDDGQVLVASTGSVAGSSRTIGISISVDLSDLIAGTTYHVVGSGYVTNFNTGVVDNWEVDTDIVFNSTSTTLAFTHSGSFLGQISVGSSSIYILVQTAGDNYANISNLSFYAYSGTAYVGLSKVTVNAISSSYVGSGITRRDSTSLSASGNTVSVPAGYYENAASKAVESGSAGTPVATKGTVSNHSVSVTPSVTNTAGYIAGGTVSGTAVSVSASELVSGSKSISISSNGSSTEDVTNYASASITVNVPNSYTASDEGKVVSNGTLVSQTSDTVTQNGTVDTTLINSLTVNVSGGGDDTGGIVYKDLDGYIHLSEEAANVISIVDTLDTAGGTIRTITGAVESGGGSENFVEHTGSITPVSDLQHFEITNLGDPAMIVQIAIRSGATDGVTKYVKSIYANGVSVYYRTNAAGASVTHGGGTIDADWLVGRTIENDDTVVAAGTISATTTGFSVAAPNGTYCFRAGYTYDWICWTYPASQG